MGIQYFYPRKDQGGFYMSIPPGQNTEVGAVPQIGENIVPGGYSIVNGETTKAGFDKINEGYPGNGNFYVYYYGKYGNYGSELDASSPFYIGWSGISLVSNDIKYKINIGTNNTPIYNTNFYNEVNIYNSGINLYIPNNKLLFSHGEFRSAPISKYIYIYTTEGHISGLPNGNSVFFNFFIYPIKNENGLMPSVPGTENSYLEIDYIEVLFEGDLDPTAYDDNMNLYIDGVYKETDSVPLITHANKKIHNWCIGSGTVPECNKLYYEKDYPIFLGDIKYGNNTAVNSLIRTNLNEQYSFNSTSATDGTNTVNMTGGGLKVSGPYYDSGNIPPSSRTFNLEIIEQGTQLHINLRPIIELLTPEDLPVQQSDGIYIAAETKAVAISSKAALLDLSNLFAPISLVGSYYIASVSTGDVSFTFEITDTVINLYFNNWTAYGFDSQCMYLYDINAGTSPLTTVTVSPYPAMTPEYFFDNYLYQTINAGNSYLAGGTLFPEGFTFQSEYNTTSTNYNFSPIPYNSGNDWYYNLSGVTGTLQGSGLLKYDMYTWREDDCPDEDCNPFLLYISGKEPLKDINLFVKSLEPNSFTPSPFIHPKLYIKGSDGTEIKNEIPLYLSGKYSNLYDLNPSLNLYLNNYIPPSGYKTDWMNLYVETITPKSFNEEYNGSLSPNSLNMFVNSDYQASGDVPLIVYYNPKYNNTDGSNSLNLFVPNKDSAQDLNNVNLFLTSYLQEDESIPFYLTGGGPSANINLFVKGGDPNEIDNDINLLTIGSTDNKLFGYADIYISGDAITKSDINLWINGNPEIHEKTAYLNTFIKNNNIDGSISESAGIDFVVWNNSEKAENNVNLFLQGNEFIDVEGKMNLFIGRDSEGLGSVVDMYVAGPDGHYNSTTMYVAGLPNYRESIPLQISGMMNSGDFVRMYINGF